MNILLVSYYGPNDYGAGNATYNLAKSLKKHGCNVFLVSRTDYPDFKTFKTKDFRFIPFFFLRDWYLGHFLKKIIRSYNIDIIHASEDRFSAVGTIKAAQSCGIGSVVHFRGYSFCCLNGVLIYREKENCSGMSLKKCLACGKGSRWFWEVYKYLYTKKRQGILKQADAKIAISSVVKRQLSIADIDSNVTVVYDPCGISVQKIEPERVVEFKKGLDISGITVLFVGSLRYHKGIMRFLELAVIISKSRKNITFLVAGDGELRSECDDFIREHSLRNVKMLGKIEQQDISLVYTASDLVVYPIMPTGFGLIPIEVAMSARPIVASRVEGIEEVITDGETGFLADKDDMDAWLSAINKLIDDPVLRKNIGDKALLNSAKFSDVDTTKQVIGIYRKINGAERPT